MATPEATSARPPRPSRADGRPVVDAQDVLDIVDLLPDVLFRCYKAEDGKIYWSFNEGGLAQEFHLTTQEIAGKSLHELFEGGASEPLVEHFEAAFRGEPYPFVNEISGRYFKHFPQPVFSEDGQVREVVGFISEVTELVLAEQRLARANEDLEAFAYTVSHDLRTPLTVVSSLASVLRPRLDPEDERGRDCLDRIDAAAQRMGSMIVDLLAFSRAGRSLLSIKDLDLSDMAKTVATELQARYAVRPKLEIQPGIHVEGDSGLLRLVLENLLGNAYKYASREPVPKVFLETLERDGHEWIVVRDNGVGFAPDEAAHAFDAFARLGTSEGFDGTGIGLSTVKRIIERHGGAVFAEGSPGVGATFGFRLGVAA